MVGITHAGQSKNLHDIIPFKGPRRHLGGGKGNTVTPAANHLFEVNKTTQNIRE